jgi:hypothetical protein
VVIGQKEAEHVGASDRSPRPLSEETNERVKSGWLPLRTCVVVIGQKEAEHVGASDRSPRPLSEETKERVKSVVSRSMSNSAIRPPS